MNVIRATADKPGFTINRGESELRDVEIVADNTAKAIAIVQTGGNVTAINLSVAGGHGPQIFAGSFAWIGGGAKKPVKKYPGCYAGDILRGLRCTRLHLKNLNFAAGCNVDETITRLMGVDECILENCTFDGTKQGQNKECLQARHVKKLTAINCRFLGSIVLGCLGPGEASDASLKVYHADAKQFRLNATFENCEVLGDVRITGQSDATFRKCRFTGPDPRGRSGNTCLNLRSFSTAYGTLKPSCIAESCQWSGWKVRAASGVVVK